jgi:ABC-type antimicrobial peptide transport system permease subunit
VRNSQNNSILGPNAVLIRLHAGVSQSAALSSLQRINTILENSPDGAGGVTPVLRPAEIVNYRSQQNTPAYLGAVLAAGAVLALALTLLASVRRRRRDLALLKTLGFTRRQLGAVVAWQSTVAVGIGTIVGVPVGIVVGRSLWDLFAHAINAVPQPTVPTLTIALIAVGALALANIVAAIPARQAARTRTAELLRAD